MENTSIINDNPGIMRIASSARQLNSGESWGGLTVYFIILIIILTSQFKRLVCLTDDCLTLNNFAQSIECFFCSKA